MTKLLLAAALGLTLAACSSSTPTGGSSPDPSTTETAGGEGSAEFLALAQSGFESDTFKMTFNATTGSDTSTITWARRGDESAFTIGEGSEAFKIIEPGDGTTISCSGDSCFESEGTQGGSMADAFIAPFTAFSSFITEAEDLPGFATSGSRTLAGRAATCASWSYFGASSEVCIDNETGLTLLWSTGAEGESLTWEVTELGEPTDEDFEPTGEVQQLPASG